jgi:hypothetical protein
LDGRVGSCEVGSTDPPEGLNRSEAPAPSLPSGTPPTSSGLGLGLAGYVFVGLQGVGSLLIGALAVGAAFASESADVPYAVVRLTGGVGLGTLGLVLAWGVARRRRWARSAALVVLWLAVFASVFTLPLITGGGEAVATGVSVVLYAWFLHYFHTSYHRFGSGALPEGQSGSQHVDAGAAVPGVRPTVVLECPSCGNAERVNVSDLFERSRYRQFSPREGFFSGNWTLECLECHRRQRFDPYEFRQTYGGHIEDASSGTGSAVIG